VELKRMTRALMVTGAVVLLCACATTPPTRYRNALHREYGQADFDRDWYECRRENTAPVSSSYAYGYAKIAGSDSHLAVNEEMAHSCLAARGWQPVTSNSAPVPATPAPRPPMSQAALSPTPSGASGTGTVLPEEKVRTEQVQRWARDVLAKPYTQAPFACTVEGWVAIKHYLVEVAPWVEAAGLRRGDHMIEVGGLSLANYDLVSEAWWKVPRNDTITVRVERAGHEVSIQLPCRDDSEAWRARFAVLKAVADGQWQACLDGNQAYRNLIRMMSSWMLRVTLECFRERAKAGGQRAPDEYFSTLHAWATKLIEESRYRPTGLTDIRSNLLAAADSLEKAGRASWANDIRQQIAAFALAPANP
jgi:hypothetical protein